ncbi:hypothetical protein [uncultured Bifidobacterium sp.]|uniref:hypothetical protein n=1 Tax=uncultured Bifidobacterium sp. TaxID=165187 RepID=UPI0028DCB85D|nr:hypothetical protein [uncultured Bifidobacterium sp.]
MNDDGMNPLGARTEPATESRTPMTLATPGTEESDVPPSAAVSGRSAHRHGHAFRVLTIVVILLALATAIGVAIHALGERGSAVSLSGTMTLSGDLKGDGSSSDIRVAASGDTLTLSFPGYDGSLQATVKTGDSVSSGASYRVSSIAVNGDAAQTMMDVLPIEGISVAEFKVALETAQPTLVTPSSTLSGSPEGTWTASATVLGVSASATADFSTGGALTLTATGPLGTQTRSLRWSQKGSVVSITDAKGAKVATLTMSD